MARGLERGLSTGHLFCHIFFMNRAWNSKGKCGEAMGDVEVLVPQGPKCL